MGNLIIFGYVTLCLLTKCVLELFHFKDKEAAGKSFLYWLISGGSVLSAFAISLFVDHFV